MGLTRTLIRFAVVMCLLKVAHGKLEVRHCDPRVLVGYDQCICKFHQQPDKGYQLKVINCTGQHFSELESVSRLRQLSVELNNNHYVEVETFIFVDNTITELPQNIVGKNSLSALAKMDLSNNHIHKIPGKTFHSMPALQELILDNNDWYVDVRSPRVFSSIFNLEILSLNNAFASLGKDNTKPDHVTVLSRVFEGSKLDYLRELYLQKNNLISVSAEVFQNLPSLEKVSLAHNFISNLEGLWNSTCFASEYAMQYLNPEQTSPLQYLDLSYNSLTTIPESFLNELDKLNKFETLNLTGNPFLCNCNLKYFHSILINRESHTSKYTVADYDTLTCKGPHNLKGKKLISVLPNELVCENISLSESDHKNHAVGIVLGIMFGMIAALLLVALYLNRGKAKQHVTYMWGNMKRYLPIRNDGYKKVEEPLQPVSV